MTAQDLGHGARIKLPERLIGQFSFESILEEAEARRGDFFPTRMAFQVARESARFLPALRKRLGNGYEPSVADVIEVPKWGGGTRPATEMALDDRLVYDALVRHLRDKTVPGLVNESPLPNQRADSEALLISGDHSHVLVADIASFYEYIRHEILLSELLDLTGESEAVEALGELLTGVMTAPLGLPQGPPSSGFLADVYASIADRRLQRAGHLVVRFSDDYRIPADSWHDAVSIQLKLERALRSIGLVVNSAKTRTPSRESYEALWIVGRGGTEEPSEPEPEVLQPEDDEVANTGEAVAFWAPYLDDDMPDGQLSLEEPDGAVVAKYQAIVGDPKFWGDRKNTDRSYSLKRWLYRVAAYDTTHLTDSLSVLLERFPHLTREVSLSLRRRMGSPREAEALHAVAVALTEHQYLLPWQRGWLFHAVIPAEGRLPESLPDAALAEFLNPDMAWFSRARAALVLATEDRLPVDAVFQSIYDAAPASTCTDFVAAAAARARKDDPLASAFVAAEARNPRFEGISTVVRRWERRKW